MLPARPGVSPAAPVGSYPPAAGELWRPALRGANRVPALAEARRAHLVQDPTDCAASASHRERLGRQ